MRSSLNESYPSAPCVRAMRSGRRLCRNAASRQADRAAVSRMVMRPAAEQASEQGEMMCNR